MELDADEIDVLTRALVVLVSALVGWLARKLAGK